MATVLEARNIVKEFPGVKALDHVSFTIEQGQIHALCGENGAGKSTLINVLSGVYPMLTYQGEIILEGREVSFKTIKDATQAGIAVIHQELSLFNEMSVAENIYMGAEIQKHGFVNWDEMFSKTREWIERLKLVGINPHTRVGELGIGQKQLVEIARVLALAEIKVLILDEPTASLTRNETDILFGVIREIRARGTACIYISHKLDEVMQLADYVTVLRDGQTVGGGSIGSLTTKEIIRMMVGREIREMYPEITRSAAAAPTVMSVQNYNVIDNATGKNIVTDASFELKRGEILGLYGLIGAGRTELVSAIYGSRMHKKNGKVFINGRQVDFKSPGDAIAAGLTYVTEDRKSRGIIPTMGIRENTSISYIKSFRTMLGINVEKESLKVAEISGMLRVKTPNLETKIVNLSGGNQQKVLLGRSLLEDVKIIILDEPTRGIDVGAKQEIYSIISELAHKNVSVIMVSSEMPEILGVCDRVLVMSRGVISGEFDNSRKDITQEQLMNSATGTEQEG